MERIDKQFFYYEIEDKIATVYFNRPPLNLFTYDVFREIVTLFLELEGRVDKDEIRVVVLTSALEKAFSAGDDVKGGPENSSEAVFQNHLARAAMDKIRNFPAPVISAVKGHALGGGMVMAMMADYVVCAENANFAFSEVNYAMFANWGTTYVLAKRCSLPYIKHLMITGEKLTVENALKYDFVQKVVPKEELMSATMDIAKVYAQKAPIAVRAIKALVDATPDMSKDAHFVMENYLTKLTFDSEDVQEGIKAFAEKREPVFKNK